MNALRAVASNVLTPSAAANATQTLHPDVAPDLDVDGLRGPRTLRGLAPIAPSPLMGDRFTPAQLPIEEFSQRSEASEASEEHEARTPNTPDTSQQRRLAHAVSITEEMFQSSKDRPRPATPTPASTIEEAPPAARRTTSIPAGARRLSVGYDLDNDLTIPKPMISGHHLVLACHEDKFYVEDLGSTNGTFVRGERLQSGHAVSVSAGEVIQLGSYALTLDDDLVERLRSARPTSGPLPGSGRVVIIGRDPECDIVLDAPQISRRHARLTQTAYGWIVEDLGSANGTFLHTPSSEPITRVEVGEQDILYMGSYRFPISRLRDFLSDRAEQRARSHTALPGHKKIITIGRGADNDIVLEAAQVSRHHARLIRKGDELLLEDLGSANGTFINGQRVGRAALKADDTVSFGSLEVKIDLERGTIHKSYRGDVLIQAENIRVDVVADGQTRRLLDGISFTAYPTEFVGIMGPSGSGKTTLLMAMIGYIHPTYGRTAINGDDLAAQYDRYRTTIGYVPQEDIIHGELTVWEALYYSAKLRLPPDTSDGEIERRINEVLAALEIEPTRHVRIGSPEQKGISGGQRKRVNLALELLTEPSLLCLDEPTSGLASEDTINVMRLLRKLADGGRTILLTIHQPSLQAYRMLDNVLYIADGEQIYYGPSYPESVLYFHPGIRPNTPQGEEILADPGSCMRPIMEAKRAGEPMETFAARYRQSSFWQEYVEERKKNQRDVKLTNKAERRRPGFRLHQLSTLCRRYLTIKLKDRVGTAILLAQAPVIGLLVDLVFAPGKHGAMNRLEHMPFALFLLVISAIWFGCANAAREIVGEQAIYRRERMVNLSIPAYVGSKIAVLGLLALVQCAMLLLTTYIALDVVGNPLWMLVTLWLCAMAGVGMGLVLSALVRTTPAALALVPLLLIPQVVLGGAIKPLPGLEDPAWTMTGLMASRWGFEALLHVEHDAAAYELAASELPKPLAPGLPALPPPPNPLDRFFGDAESALALNLAVLSVAVVLLSVAACVALIARERRA
jgi:ABC-type multidrug transport system ATPase subunit/predicted component of type VI protein secretion system